MSELHIPLPGVGIGVGDVSVGAGGGDLGIPIVEDSGDEIEGEAEIEIGD